MFTQRTIIWDQLIRCFGQQERKPIALLLSKLKYWQELASSTRHTLSSHSLALLEKSLVHNLPAKQFYQHSQEILSTLIIDLKKYDAQLKRDSLILLDEQRLSRVLQKNQNDVLIFLEKLSSGLIEKKTNSEFGFIAPDILYTLKVKLNELRLQVSITEKSSVNLDLIQRKNQALISSISAVLAPSLNTLKKGNDTLWLMDKATVV